CLPGDKNGRQANRARALHHDGFTQAHRPASIETAQYRGKRAPQCRHGKRVCAVREFEESKTIWQPCKIGIAAPVGFARIFEEARILARCFVENGAAMAPMAGGDW